MDNANSAEYLEKIKIQVIENIRRTNHKPSVQMTDVPPDIIGMDEEADGIARDADEDDNKDTRYTQHRWDKHTEHDGELSDTEEFSGGNARNGVHAQGPWRRNRTDFQNQDEEQVMAEASTAPGEAAQASASSTNGRHAAPGAQSRQPTPRPDDGDDDVEMSNGVQPNVTAAAATVPTVEEGPQNATPPASPPVSNAVPAAITPADTDGDQIMADEDIPQVTLARGAREGNEENVIAEQSASIAQES